jgi:hypothetical protein
MAVDVDVGQVQPVENDLVMTGGRWNDSAAKLPGQEFIGGSVIVASPGAAWALQHSTATGGDAAQSLSGVVQAGDRSILGKTFRKSVRSVAAVPEAAVSLLMCAGPLVLAAVHRRVRVQPPRG